MRTKILIIDEKISLLKAQERRWYIDVIAQEDNGRIYQLKRIYTYTSSLWERKVRNYLEIENEFYVHNIAMIAEIILNSAGHLASFKRIQQSKTVGSKNLIWFR